MIKLDLPLRVCNECPNFEPDIDTIEIIDMCGARKTANHTIKCKNSALCEELVKFLVEEKENERTV